MATDYARGYSRGYNTGVHGRWPDHRPIVPPDGVLVGLVGALQKLRDAVDGEICLFAEDDEINLRLGPMVDAADEQLGRLGKWIRTGETE